MKCVNHILRSAAGYCSVCGAFVCQDCISHHEGNSYCPKHFKPFASEMEREKKRSEIRQRHGRHKLVIRYADGRAERGVCLALNIKERGFYLEKVDDDGATLGETQSVRFSELKAVFNVKSFDGKFSRKERYQEYTPGGEAMVVEFKDGETVEGKALRAYEAHSPRFYLIPNDPNSNNINILVEQASIAKVYSPEEYERKKQQESAVAVEAKKKPASKDLSQEESMGDFYFDEHNFSASLEQYRVAVSKNGDSPRLTRKMVVCIYNIGAQYVKRRKYPEALKSMEAVLELDPNNDSARKKAKKLRQVIEKTEKRMEAYFAQNKKSRGP